MLQSNESGAQALNEQKFNRLNRKSGNEQIKSYFSKVFELKKSGKKFPVDLDTVWPLSYSRKEDAVRALKNDFVEDTHFQVLRKIAENRPNGGRPTQKY